MTLEGLHFPACYVIVFKNSVTIYRAKLLQKAFRDEVCRKMTFVCRRSNTLRCRLAGATVNGSTLWRHPDEPGAEGATYAARMNLSGKRTEKILQHSISIVVSSIPCMFHIWDLLFPWEFLRCFPENRNRWRNENVEYDQ